MIRLVPILTADCPDVMHIDRSDISEDWVDAIPDIMALHRYGLEHRLIGRTYTIYAEDACIGILLMGEGIPWACDPPELANTPFYRIMGFVIDRAWRGKGIGSQALKEAIRQVYAEFGPRPICIGVQQDNTRAAAFYLRHGFRPTDSWDEDDRFYLRWPE